MIVDDDDGIRDLLKFFAAKEGFRVKAAADGESALAEIQDARPDLILLDLMLPLRSGFEVLRDLNSSAARKIPVIVITGHYATKAAKDYVKRESDVVDFLIKPIDTNALVRLMHRVLNDN